ARDDPGRDPAPAAIEEGRTEVARAERTLLEPADHGAHEPDDRVAVPRREREVGGARPPADAKPRLGRCEDGGPRELGHARVEPTLGRDEPAARDDGGRSR